jgi:hypothetical protein
MEKLAVRVVLPALASVRAAARCPLATMLPANVFAGAELAAFLRPLWPASITCSPR